MQSKSEAGIRREFPFGRTGMIGDYANLEKLNGNYDLLDAMDMQVNSWTRKTIDAHDWKTWPAWMVREIGHTDNRALLENFDCDCGSCEPTYDELRDEVSCHNCGLLAGSVLPTMQEDYETARDRAWENDAQIIADREHEEFFDHQWQAVEQTHPDYTSVRKPKRDEKKGQVYILWVESEDTISFEDPITGEMITETYKVQLTVTTGDTFTEAVSPITGKLEYPDGFTYVGRDRLVQADERAQKARYEFETHNITCMVGQNHGHPDNCRECRRLYNRMMKKGTELKNVRDRLTLQV